MASSSLISPDLPAHVGPYRNRIVGFRVMRVVDLLDNPHNWRLHPQAQLDALDGILNEVGVIAAPIFNQQTGNLFDGHGRKKLYLADQEAVTPVIIVDLSPEEEKKALLTFDPLSALAEANNEALAALTAQVETDNAAAQVLLTDLTKLHDLDLLNPEDFDPADFDPGEDRYREQYGVIVICSDEAEQAQVYERLHGEGYTVRVVVT